MKNEDLAIMRLWKAYISGSKKNFELSKQALKQGICIDKNCPKKIMAIACEVWGKDGFLLNQTFHKSFHIVLEKNQEDLVLEQVFHYMTTYGLETIGKYDENLVFIPKEKLEIPDIKDNIKFIKISKITKNELKKRLWTSISSSFALSKNTIQDIYTLKKYLEITKDNINDIKNKELKIMFCDDLNLVPNNPVEFLRFLIYKLTGNTLLIKDKKTIEMLKISDRNLALKLLKKYDNLYGLEKLSEIYNRYKVIFISLKTGKKSKITEKDLEIGKSKNFQKYGDIIRRWDREESELEVNTIINKLSHLCKKHHKPFIKNDLEEFVKWCNKNSNENELKKDLERKLESAPIFRIIKLREYLSYKSKALDNNYYKIRNGKVWVDTCYIHKPYSLEVASNLLDSIIIEKLRKKVNNKKIYLEENVNLVLPQSEKQFLGNIPFGTSITLEKENILVGIHWFNLEDQRIDLDLKIISHDYSIGWDTSYKAGNKLIFSGDVTDAPYPNGASEYIYIDKKIGKTLFSLKVNNFTRNQDDVFYEIIIAKGKKEKLQENYIVDPNDIILKIPNNRMEVGNAEHSLGTIVVSDKEIELYFTDLTTGNRSIASNSNLEEILNQLLVVKSKCQCNLREYLEKAGAIIITDFNQKENVDYDFSVDNLKKDSLMDILLS